MGEWISFMVKEIGCKTIFYWEHAPGVKNINGYKEVNKSKTLELTNPFLLCLFNSFTSH